jgi:hypothetical protein
VYGLLNIFTFHNISARQHLYYDDDDDDDGAGDLRCFFARVGAVVAQSV